MIDIKLIRENPGIVKENIKKKFQTEKLPTVDKIKKKDEEWRKLKNEIDELRHERNSISKEISEAKKSGKNPAALMKKAKSIPEKIEELESESQKIEQEINEILVEIPNFISKKTPSGKDDSENVETKVIGKPTKLKFDPKNHVEIGESLGVLDFESSARTSGKGFYYMKGDLALLNQALINFAIGKLASKGFTYVETPLMLRKDVINNVTDLNDQKNQIYKIDGEDLYLIGTSEHSLIGRYLNTLFQEAELPIKNASYSMCFRKEIGSHGIEEKGLFRTHQFNKVEMIVICSPNESEKFFDELQGVTIEIFKELEIPIRVLEICSGALGNLKHRQVDIEAWSPLKETYYEVGSCSNLTDAQARKLKIRAISRKGEKFVPHTLNNTAIATSRALVAILENFQNADGSVTIPKPLQDYMHGKKKIEARKI